jgi:hypothetical protein
MEEQQRFWEHPIFRALVGFSGFVLAYLALGFLLNYFANYFGDPIRYSIDELIDVFACAIGLIVWMTFFAQFILPVKTFGDRLKIVDRLVTYVTGGHGPALFVENGIVREREGESKRKGPGVIWMDSASAAVLRTEVKFTRTVGPGVHFTEHGEYIAATADLHTLSQVVGPDEKDVDDRDPFKVTREKAPDDFDAIQNRRWETSAMTRDGIEVVATISVAFRIKANAGEGHTQFGFNKENAEKAIRDSIIRGAQLDQPVWSELPAKMAVDVWREYLRKFRLSELFEIPDDRTETALQMIAGLVKKRLGQKEVDVLDDFGQVVLKDPNRWEEYNRLIKSEKKEDNEKAGELVKKVTSSEFEKLTNMGLDVSGVLIRKVLFPPDVEDRILSQWTTLWLKNAQKERDLVERNRKLEETAGHEEALKEFANNATQELSQVRAESKAHALEMLVHSTFLGVRRNSALLKRTNTEQRELSDIFSWLRDKRGPS